MKKIFSLFLSICLMVFSVTPAMATKPIKNINTTIQSGVLSTTDDPIVTTGYNKCGYNYNANRFDGFSGNYNYGNYECQDPLVTEGERLVMQWNDAYSNSQGSYIGSGAWYTTRIKGEYENWDLFGNWVF